ncbi:hypothetical protein Rhe02_26910 [Rhizocola hellebori]|uniref:ABC3 transporter permease C-terminal domain-containing protein n=1 Tax=Rhizocola hellebori TaxID=1392758 RepID=A0A8J3Q740_9ACTN|nr:FtsX-like permease family protein [Rhizocola hellebori]GIH04624.1 hypothetical protein Rhe02_26910 [Rhizocola hellebori]
MTGWSVMLRGIRHRSGRSLVVLLIAAFATLAAVLIPAYGRAAAQSVLTDGMRSAPITAASVTISAEGSAAGAAGGAFDPAQQPVAEAKTLADTAFRKAPNLAAVLDRPISSVETDAQVALAAGAKYGARLAWRLGACGQLTINGSCAIDAEQVVISERSAKEAGIKLGDVVTVRAARGDGEGRRLQVVGLYTPRDATNIYWGNSTYFAHSAMPGDGGLPRLDAIFTGSEDDVRLPGVSAISARLTYPLKPDAVRLDSVPALRTELGALGLALNSSELQLETALLSIADDVAKDQAALASSVPLIAVPLLLLAWVVLFLLVAALAQERGPELALARLRGYPNARAARFGLSETLLLVFLAAPVGLVAGVGLVELTCRTVLAPGTHVELRWPVFAAAAAGLVLACVAAWLATRRTLASGVLTLLRRVPQRARKRAGIAEAIVVTLAVVGLVAALQDRSNSLALLAPAALALVAGVVAGRILVLWARLRLGLARRRGNIPGILASAQLARRPGSARNVVVLTAAVALLAFAAVSWDVALRARSDHARDSLGAATVYQVAAAHPEALVAAVKAADPSGRAMAVVRADEQYAQGKVELLGIQSELLSTVAVWRGQDKAQLGALGDKLRGKAEKKALVGGDLTVRASFSGLGEVPLRFGALISAPGQPPTVAWLGDVKNGLKDYSGQIAGCGPQTGCRLVGFSLGRSGGLGGTIRAALTLHEVRSAQAVLALRTADATAWKVATDRNPAARIQFTPGPDRLVAAVESSGPGDVVFSYLDSAATVPAVLSGTTPGEGDTFVFPGLADVPQEFSVIQHTGWLPRAGAHALLFDLDLAVRLASGTAGLADAADLRYEVWAAADAPAGLDRKLADQGVRVLRTQTIDSELEQLGRKAPALGFRLFLLAGVAAAGLALGVLLLGWRLGAAERRDEMAALRATGVRARVLRRALRRERLASLVLPLVIGLGTGLGSAVLMLPGLALVTASVTIPALDLWAMLTPRAELAALPLALLGALLVVITGLLSAGRLARGGTK